MIYRIWGGRALSPRGFKVMEVDPQDNHGSGGPSSVIVVYIMDPLGYEGSEGLSALSDRFLSAITTRFERLGPIHGILPICCPFCIAQPCYGPYWRPNMLLCSVLPLPTSEDTKRHQP